MSWPSPLETARPVLDSIDGRVYAVVEDLVDGRRWERDADVVLPAASTIKVAIMVQAFRMQDDSRLDMDRLMSIPKSAAAGGSGVVRELHDGVQLSVMDLTTLMIILSDNTATNAMLDIVGFNGATQAAIHCGAKSTVIKRKLMGGPFYDRPDYSLAIDNTTSAGDMAGIMKSIHLGKAASGASCEKMLGILLKQQVNDRLPLLLPAGTRVAHKTGEFQTTRHDAGIVFPASGGHPYAISLMTTGLKDVVAASRSLAEASRIIYREMAGQ